MHRGLSLHALLVDNSQRVRLSNFDSACFVQPHERLFEAIRRNVEYQAPEMVSGAGYTLETVDAWAAGIIIYELLAGQVPFKDYGEAMTKEKIRLCEFAFPAGVRISPEAKDFLCKLLQPLDLKRIELDKVAQHPWFSKNKVPTALPLSFPLKPPCSGYL